MENAAKHRSGRKTTSLNSKLDRRLAAYIAAGSAASAGFLALAPPAEARIIYTPANVKIHDGYFPFHLNPNGLNEMGFHQRCTGVACTLSAYGKGGNGIQAVGVTSYISALALEGGSTIGPDAPFVSESGARMAGTVARRFRLGYWFVSGARFLGVRFQINGKTHYGWMRLVNSSQNGATLTGYAYETIPGKPIRAGYRRDDDDLTREPQDGTPDESVPMSSLGPQAPPPSESGSLGMLALGAEGIPLWRRDTVRR
jgi:hypothetical protein